MRLRSAMVANLAVIALALTGCTTTVQPGTATPVAETIEPAMSAEPVQTAGPTTSADPVYAAAHEQAEAWLDAAAVPPGAVRSDEKLAGFSSWTAWPCTVAELEAYWTIADTSVAGAANWIMENPTADLVTTAVGPMSDDPAIDATAVGYTPADRSQQGVVYTVAKTNDGVKVRAEIAAMTGNATCETPPAGSTWGPPGQG